ncbi:hypothetical protein VaNZ11_002909 [Volvox africanus]|uniref:mTERF domain-containing protein 1, mitochondrial n=1 Tax=Volvox africanus TaxID=51714 RepID=A0ABQ5RU13_9CHLO|nr:hypothetical protein VaNZ11_002909 [Volvox africanus]
MMNTQSIAALPSQRLLLRRSLPIRFCHFLNALVRPLAPSAQRGLCRSTAPFDAMTATALQHLEDLDIPVETFHGVRDVGDLGRNAEAALTTLTTLSSRQRVKTLLTSNPQLLCVPLEVWLDFLTAYGMSRQDFFGLLGAFPELFSQGSLFNAGNVIVYLQSLGLSPRDVVATVIRRHPEVLLQDVQYGLKPPVEFLRLHLGLDAGSVRDFLCRCPGVLTQDAADLVPRLELLCGVGLDVAAARQLLFNDGSLLTGDLEPTLQLRLHFLTSDCGLSPDQALRVLRSCPDLMSFTVANLGRKWRFLKERMGGGKEQVLEYPKFLTKNLLLQIGPRFSYATERLGLCLSRSSSNNNSPCAERAYAFQVASNDDASGSCPCMTPFSLRELLDGDDLHFLQHAWAAAGCTTGRSGVPRWEAGITGEVEEACSVRCDDQGLGREGTGASSVWDADSLLVDFQKFRSSWLEREGARWTGVRNVGVTGSW